MLYLEAKEKAKYIEMAYEDPSHRVESVGLKVVIGPFGYSVVSDSSRDESHTVACDLRINLTWDIPQIEAVHGEEIDCLLADYESYLDRDLARREAEEEARHDWS
jgi:hypothetical protein